MNEAALRQAICGAGRRLYHQGFTPATDGNISVRLGQDEILCTPTRLCKGFLNPEELCKVDLAGNQLAGGHTRTSEILLHLAVYRARADVQAVVHCHPPHATAFAVAHEPLPQWVLAEVELFLGQVAMAPYETTGTQKFADTILPYIQSSNTILLANHGTVAYGANLDTACGNTEIIDAYCRIIILARQLGHVHQLSKPHVRELLQLKKRLGYPDARAADEIG
jgi:L-fuculose-phosphate aldolase